MSSPKIKGSDLLVKALENEGVERIFGVPGEENLDVVESLRCSKIDLVVTRHEQAAAFMAATYGRLTGHPGVCISTLGPGGFELFDRRCLRPSWRHANDPDHRPERNPDQ
jgi:acetolactate synthase-1/2/3 large subunit